MKLYRFALTLSLLVAAALFVGCGGGTKSIVQQDDPTGSLSASPASITSGSSSTLSWETTYAASASIDNGVGSASPVSSGSVKVTPTKTTTYTLTVNGTDGVNVTATATVTVSTPQTTVTITCPPLVQIGMQGNVVPPATYVCVGKASDGKAVSYAVTSGSGLNVDSKTGALETTATDSDIANNDYLSATVAATSSDGTAKASATILVTDWFLAENGHGTQIMTSKGAVVQGFSLYSSAEAFAPDHMSFAAVTSDSNDISTGFAFYAIAVTETNGTVSVGITKTGSVAFTTGITMVGTPSYSPDGTTIVFVGFSNDNRSMGTYVIATNGQSPEKDLYPDPGYGNGSILVGVSYPHFTADGKSIDFERYVNGQTQIWKMNSTDGSDQTALIDTPDSHSPFPTADGKYLMFMNDGIYQANIDGSGAELVVQTHGNNSGTNGWLAAVAPDGKQVMYLMNDPAKGGWWFIWTANVDGSDQTQITPASGTLMPESWGN